MNFIKRWWKRRKLQKLVNGFIPRGRVEIAKNGDVGIRYKVGVFAFINPEWLKADPIDCEVQLHREVQHALFAMSKNMRNDPDPRKREAA